MAYECAILSIGARETQHPASISQLPGEVVRRKRN
jgi:hypothetical protein